MILLNVLKVIPRSLRPIAILSACWKIVYNKVATDAYDSIHVTERDADVKATKDIELEPGSVTSDTAVYTARSILLFERNMALVQHQLRTVNDIMEVISNIKFAYY